MLASRTAGPLLSKSTFNPYARSKNIKAHYKKQPKKIKPRKNQTITTDPTVNARYEEGEVKHD